MIKPNKKQPSSIFSDVVAAIFILLFVYTALSKIIDHNSFKAVLSRSPLTSGYENIFSVAIPAIEIIVTVVLFFPRTRRQGLVLSSILMIVFTSYISYMVLFVPHLPCSCGGIIQKLSWSQHLLLNGFLSILGLTSVFQHKLFFAKNRGSRKPVETSRSFINS